MLLARWNIHPGYGTWITCYVWETIEDMQEAASESVPEWDGDSFGACWIANAWRYSISDDGEDTLKTRKLGEMHFTPEVMGAKIVAHEIQHFVNNWIDDDPTNNDEELATMVGDLHGEFWVNWYENFDAR